MSTYCEAGTILVTGDIAVHTRDKKCLPLVSFHIHCGESVNTYNMSDGGKCEERKPKMGKAMPKWQGGITKAALEFWRRGSKPSI